MVFHLTLYLLLVGIWFVCQSNFFIFMEISMDFQIPRNILLKRPFLNSIALIREPLIRSRLRIRPRSGQHAEADWLTCANIGAGVWPLPSTCPSFQTDVSTGQGDCVAWMTRKRYRNRRRFRGTVNWLSVTAQVLPIRHRALPVLLGRTPTMQVRGGACDSYLWYNSCKNPLFASLKRKSTAGSDIWAHNIVFRRFTYPLLAKKLVAMLKCAHAHLKMI